MLKRLILLVAILFSLHPLSTNANIENSISDFISWLNNRELLEYEKMLNDKIKENNQEDIMKILEIAIQKIQVVKKENKQIYKFVENSLNKAYNKNLITKEEKEALEKNRILLKKIINHWKTKTSGSIRYILDNPLDSVISLVYTDDFLKHPDGENYQKNKIEQLLFHEIWHIRYFKDKNNDSFNQICWENKEKNICEFKDFVSQYARTNNLEDYAETFSFVNSIKFNNNDKTQYQKALWNSDILQEKIKYIRNVKAY